MTTDSIQDLRHRDRIDVVRETEGGEEEDLTVFNWVNISQVKQFRGGNPTMEAFDPSIGAGDSARKPEAVTKWVAEEIETEEHIDVRKHGIEVVDLEADNVEIYF